ncbi:excalibur calcium-binding domain-containing protein [Sphingomonas sp. 1P08PE]|uniref:excalibur calcium-binding domain-containing protein n=1 Tax=Sphingomonas sp. 1P08PE TaxID=554122 RepID=UPI0039A04DB9
MTGYRSTIATVFIGAGLTGAVVGIGSTATTVQGRDAIISTANRMGVATGFKRQRPPQPGDHWRGCNDARAAGTAPIYRGEPGYRPGMDGDDDGIACEPYRA